MATKKEAKAETPAKPVEEKKAPEPQINYVTTKELAEKLGTKPTILRRYLRSLPKFQDSGYTRYKWNPEDKADAQLLADLEAGWAKYKRSEEEKAEARKEEARKKAENKKEAASVEKPKKGGSKKDDVVAEESDDEIFSEDEDEDEVS